MRLKLFFIITISFALSGCVPGTVEFDDSGEWRAEEDKSQQTDPDSPTDTGMDSPDMSEPSDDSEDPDPSNNSTDPIGDDPDMSTDPEPECPSGQDMCSEMCVDLTTDANHCGACDNPCPAGSSCSESACVCDGANEQVCDGTCVDTTTSSQHCGECNMPCSGGMICSSGQCVENTEVAGVLQQTNAARAAGADCGSYGVKDPVPALEGDPELHIAAQAHAEDMAENDFFSHTGSDGSSFVDRIRRTDFVGSPIGENIAAGYGSPSAVVAGWIDSDGHCRNLMNGNATKLGIGYTTGGQYGTLWVQVFGR